MLTLVYGDDVEKVDEFVSSKYLEQGFSKFLGTPESLIYKSNNKSLFDESFETIKVVYNLEVNKVSSFSSLFPLQAVFSKKDNKHLILVDYTGKIINSEVKFDNKSEFKIKVDDNIFKLVDSIFEQKLEKSLLYLNPYFLTSNEGYVLSMVFYMMKNILKYHYQKEEFKKLNPYVQSKILVIAKKSSISKTKSVIFALSEADYKIKSGGDPKTILSSLVVYLAK